MVARFRSSLVLALVASQMVGVYVRIKPANSFHWKTKKILEELKVDIQNGGSWSLKTELPSQTQGFGVQCLSKKQQFSIKLRNQQQRQLSPKFRLAFDSGAYEEHKTFEKEVEGFAAEEFCITWGSWWPLAKTGDRSIELYFNIFKNKADVTSRYLFLFDIYAGMSYYPVDLRVGRPQTDAKKRNKEPFEIIRFTSKSCQHSVSKTSSFAFGQKHSYTHVGIGKFKMSLLVSRTQEIENEVKKAFDLAKTNPKAQIDTSSSKIWNNMNCLFDKFEYLIPASSTQKTGSHILI